MYVEFLETLLEIAKHLNEAAKLGGGVGTDLPRPYVAGKVDINLDGTKVGEFTFEDDWVIYQPIKNEKV